MTQRYSDTGRRTGPLAGLLATLTVSFARGDSKVAPDLDAAAGPVMNVVVQFRHTPSSPDHQKVNARGGVLRREWKAVHAAAYALPAEAVSTLAADPDVAHSPMLPIVFQAQVCWFTVSNRDR
jgi:hypothetical protein